MRFSWSAHLQMYLSVETLISIIMTGLAIQVELIVPVNSVINDLISNDLLKCSAFLLKFQTLILTVLHFWIYLFLLTIAFVLQWLSLHCEILNMLLSQFPLTFHHIHNGMPYFIALLMIILVLIGMVCDHLRDIPWEDYL